MPVLFENKYQSEKKFFKETVFYSHFRKSFSICLMLFMAALLAPNLFFAIRSNWQGVASVISVIIGIVFFTAYFVAYPFRVISDSKKALPDDSYTISVTENKFTYNAPRNAEIDISFAKIKKTANSRHYILLISENDDIYAFKKDGFEKGSYKEFLEFLKSKKLK